MGKPNRAQLARKRRHVRVRKQLEGTPERPRLNVYRSLNHIYAQIIDDSRGSTLLSVSSVDPSLRKSLAGKTRTEQAAVVGKTLAERASRRSHSTATGSDTTAASRRWPTRPARED